MGLLDMFGGGSPPQKALKLKAKVTQKYGDATVRQKAISQLAELKVPEAISVLLSRFTIAVEPQSTDAYEKDQVFEVLKEMGRDVVEPAVAFLKRTDTASSWVLRILDAVLPAEEQRAGQDASIFHKGVADELLLRKLIEDHHKWTGSLRARDILDHWSSARGRFVKVFPSEYKRALGELHAHKEAGETIAKAKVAPKKSRVVAAK